MNIIFRGLEDFKITQGDKTLVFNSSEKQKKNVIYLYSINNQKMKTDNFSTEAFTIDSGGEFEINNVFIKAFQTETILDNEKKILTIFKVLFDGLNLVFLGPISNSKKIPNEILENLIDADIVFIPIGGNDVLETSEAYDFAIKLNSKIIIPMHYSDSKILNDFLKNFSTIQEDSKLIISKKDLDKYSASVFVLKD